MKFYRCNGNGEVVSIKKEFPSDLYMDNITVMKDNAPVFDDGVRHEHGVGELRVLPDAAVSPDHAPLQHGALADADRLRHEAIRTNLQQSSREVWRGGAHGLTSRYNKVSAA